MSVSAHQTTVRDALRWLDFYLGWAPGADWMQMRAWEPSRERTWFREVGHPDGLIRSVAHCDLVRSEQVELGIPVKRRFGGTTVATCLWAVVEGGEQNRWLERFRPQPGLVLRIGSSSRRVALWALTVPMDTGRIVRGNRRIAHRLRAPKKYAEPEAMWVPAPGSCVREGRSRPAPVLVERLEVGEHTPAQIMGRLKDPPDADAWMKGRAG